MTSHNQLLIGRGEKRRNPSWLFPAPVDPGDRFGHGVDSLAEHAWPQGRLACFSALVLPPCLCEAS